MGAGCGGDDGDAALPVLESLEAGAPVLDVADLRGPVLVNLWATWCTPCREEMPALEDLYASGGGEVIGVNVGDTSTEIGTFLEEIEATYPQYVDPKGDLMIALEVTGLPATAVIDAEGSVVQIHQGALDRDGFESLLRSATP